MNYRELLDRPIAYQRCFVSLGAGITGALMLSQAVYWSNRTNDEDYWFYKTQKEWTDETGMTRNEQETARKKLLKLGVLEEKKQGIPCKLYYRVNYFELKKLLQTSMLDSSKLESDKPASSDVEIPHTITENTQENTSDILSSDEKTGDEDNEFLQNKNKPISDKPKIKDCPHDAIVQLYEQILPELPQIAYLNDTRKKHLQARWRENEIHQSLDFWRDYFTQVKASNFLTGKVQGINGNKPFRATFDWLINASNFLKVVEGNYA